MWGKMAKSITNYKCLACGGGLRFDPTSGKVVCEYCDSTFTIEEMEKAYDTHGNENPASGTESSGQNQNENSASENHGDEWNTDGLNSDWGADGANMKEYNCPSCGANILCEASTAATSCPYCDNPTVIETQFSGNLRPDYIIPFKLKKQEAVDALKKFYKGKTLLPKLFSEENHLQEVKGIYVPFWLFNATADARMRYHATKSTTVRHGENVTTTTSHYDCARSGTIDFEKIPVDASKKMPDDLMDSLEPFNYADLADFSTAYLPGYLADKYDVSVEDCFERANQRCLESAESVMRKTVSGYDSVSLTDKQINLKKGAVKYGLLPVYLLYTKWNDEKFLFGVNGQTGKVVGNLPISGGRCFLHFIKKFFIYSVIAAFAIVAFTFISRMI